MADPSYKRCFATAHAAAGRELSDDELDELFSSQQTRMNRLIREGMDPRTAASEAGARLANESRTARMIEKRSQKLNLMRRSAILDRIREGDELRSVRELITGREAVNRSAGLSVDAEAHAKVADSMGPLIADLQRAGLRKALTKRDMPFDRDVARELWALEDPSAPAATGNAQARQTAEILHKHQDLIRAAQNDAGAWIGKTDHYITRQSHDMWKIRGDGSQAAYQAWRDSIASKLSDKTFDGLEQDTPAAREGFLKSVWQALSSGVHESANGADWLSGFKGPANLAKKVSQERLLHFKSADDWFDYNHQFGHGAVVDSVVHGMERGARNAAIMRVMGTNPEAMFDHVMDRLVSTAKGRDDFKMVDKLRAMKNGHLFDAVTHKAAPPQNKTIATIGSYVRGIQSLSKLGGVVLSSLPDVAITSSVARHNGIPLLESYANQLKAILPTGAGRREVAQHLGVGIEGMLGGIANRFRGEHGPLGKMSRTVELFHKVNGLTYWIDSMKEGLGLMLTHNLGRNSFRSFDQLHDRMQNGLRRYGIEEGEWDVMRQAAARAADGRMHLLPAELSNLSDEAVAGLTKPGQTADEVRSELRSKLSTYVIDQTREGTSEPTAAVRSMVQGSYQKLDSVHPFLGEAMRAFMQFKTFPLTHFSRSVMREVSRDGFDVAGVAHLIVGTTALGYLAMTLKQLAAGRNPRDPQTPGDYLRTVMAALAQGGGLGIYGDFMFGEANRFGDGPFATELGPTFGTAENLAELLQGLRDGGIDEASGEMVKGHQASDWLQFAKANAPFLNLFYTRAALDYLVFYRLQEMMNPGYLERMEARVKQQQNQTFWLSPSAVAHSEMAQ